MDVGAWLRSLGLEQYEPAFRENAVDEAVLPSLTADDLKDLGVGLVGHRRKLLDAIAALRAGAEKDAAPSDPRAPAGAPAADDAERRQVTVMFADLVGSTALSARMDPEDLREVISTYHRCVAETVRRFDGFVAKYMGDGVLAYFGYPTAHEDDGERAVRAGLALIDGVTALKTSAPLRVRIGIATGLVVVGDLIGSGEAQERGIVGETPNIAARLQTVAEPNTVVIAESTRRLLGNLFELQDLGAQDLKGIAGPTPLWAALRPSSVEGRFEALRAANLTVLVGREEETELLLRRWSTAKTGQGQVVLLSGEAGIGKSRLTAALLEGVTREPHTRLRYFCSPQHTDSVLHPIIGQLERSADLAHDDTAQARLDKLDTVLAQGATSNEDAALLAELLSLPNDGRHPALDLSPQQRRERTLQALERRIAALERQNPVLMIFEDAHWSDPTSRELLDRIVDGIETLRVLLVVTFRPEFAAPWIGRAHVTALAVNRLAQREIGAIIDCIAGNRPLPASLRRDIIERTDGIPLFVEEMTKAVLEAESEDEASRTAAAAPSQVVTVPASLHASLTARLDRLGRAKEVAQTGAAIGREFAHALLLLVTRMPEQELETALDRLVEAGLLFRHGVPPQATYLFKHALVQDAAYAALLRARRIELHARIADALQQQFPDVCEAQPEVPARHFTQAGLSQQAIGYWQRAGDRAAKRSANQEAVAHFRKAIELLDALPDDAARAEQELQLLIALGPALMTMRSSSAPEIGRVYARAREIAGTGQRAGSLFPSVWGAWLVAMSSGDQATAVRLLDELFEMAEASGDGGLTLQAHHAAWPIFTSTGELGKARHHAATGLALYRRDAHGDQALQYGAHDPAVCAYVNDALVAAVMGYPDQALRRMENGLSLARELDHAPTLVQALAFAADLHQIRREPHQALEFLTVLLPLLEKHGSAVGLANATMLRGWATIMQGGPGVGLDMMREGLVAWRATGSKLFVSYRIARAAEAHLVAGDIDGGLRLMRDAPQPTGDAWFLPELHRLHGELLGKAGRVDEMEEHLERALDMARKQNARLLELRTAVSLVRARRGQGRPIATENALAPVYLWFTEGLDTADLLEAKALIDDVT